MQRAQLLEIGPHTAVRDESDHGVARLRLDDRNAGPWDPQELPDTIDDEVEHGRQVQGRRNGPGDLDHRFRLGAAPLQRLFCLLALGDVAADLHERTPAVTSWNEERLRLDHALHPGRALPASLCRRGIQCQIPVFQRWMPGHRKELCGQGPP